MLRSYLRPLTTLRLRTLARPAASDLKLQLHLPMIMRSRSAEMRLIAQRMQVKDN